MLLVKKGQINNLTVTCSQNKSGESPVFYLFSFQHTISKTIVRFYGTQLISNDRYDEFIFEEITDTTTVADPLNGKVKFAEPGQYYYSIYEMGTKTLNPSTARQKLEEGRGLVYDVVNPEYFTEYISSNENNSNYIYLD
tara:strand:+ start:1494 stop:1910 length:417 start_codon:yes stop_codon:yes gene_type:complete